MPINGAISIGILDFAGKRTSLPINFHNTSSALADIQDYASGVALAGGLVGAVDAAIDGQVESVSVSLLLALPTTLKSAPVTPQRAQDNALIDFVVVGSPNTWGIAVPTAAPACFSGDTVVNSGVMGTLITYLLAQHASTTASDRYNNLLASYKRGRFSSRKKK